MTRLRPGPRNDPRDLRLVTVGQGVSLLGDAVTGLALPIVAVDLLRADSLGTGILGAASTVAYLLLGLQAGAWADRYPRRRLLLAADAVRAALLLAIPLLYALQLLTLPLLVLIQAGLGTATVFFNVTWPAYLPRVARGATLVRMNGRLSVLGDGAGFVGPGLAGVLIAVANAPLALVADAASFVASFASLRAIRTVEPPAPRRRAGHRMVDDIRAGALAIWRRPTLRLITLEAISGNVAFSIMIGQSVIYQRLDLGFGPALIGAISSIGFLGGAVGGLAAPHLLRRVGFGRLLLVATILFGLDEFVQPLASVAPSALAFPLVAANFFFGGLFLALWVVPVVSYRATVIPDALRGRAMGVIRLLTFGCGATAGYVAGGLIANVAGRPFALVLSALMQLAVPIAAYGGARIWRLRTIAGAARADNAAARRATGIR